MNRESLLKKFEEIFGNSEAVRFFFAPGRVNLIGEHIDYNGGLVFPCALEIGTTALARGRNDNIISFASVNFDFRKEISCDRIIFDKNDGWTNYPKGVASVIKNSGYELRGFDVLYYGNIPNGSGLSSSASIEMATATLISGLFDLNIPMIDRVKISKKAENEFVGVNCGIMDMFAIGMGKKGMAISLNCNTLDYTYVPVKLNDYTIVIANTNKKRGLADSKYNERRNECERALSILNNYVKAETLCEISISDFEKYGNKLNDEILIKRVRHVISENLRVKEAISCLSGHNDLHRFGTLMNQSHLSLRDDYEVTGKELDALVEESWKIDGVIGSRMTGAGFGGCTVSIVKNEKIEEFKKYAGKNYNERTGLKADFYETSIGNGSGEI